MCNTEIWVFPYIFSFPFLDIKAYNLARILYYLTFLNPSIRKLAHFLIVTNSAGSPDTEAFPEEARAVRLSEPEPATSRGEQEFPSRGENCAFEDFEFKH